MQIYKDLVISAYWEDEKRIPWTQEKADQFAKAVLNSVGNGPFYASNIRPVENGVMFDLYYDESWTNA